MTLDNYQKVIHELYIVQKKPLSEVLQHLEEAYGLKVAPQALKRKLRNWNYRRNVSRQQAFALIRAAANGSDEGTNADSCQPVPARQLELYLQRNKLSLDTRIRRSLPPAQVWKVPEHIFLATGALLAGSFESRYWASAGDELIITSCSDQGDEAKCLHAFLGHLDMATIFGSCGNMMAAGHHWMKAFENVDVLTAGRYHDHLPNIVQKINDLHVNGYSAVAIQLQKQLAEFSKAHHLHGPTTEIFQSLRLVHLDDMKEIEERIMQNYVDSFEKYLGLLHYNSFVMRMNLARRILLRKPWACLEEHIPSLSVIESIFGPCDTRSLDIIRLRIEVLHHRAEHTIAAREAELLIQRARRKVADNWQRLYFLIKGYYYLGLSQNLQGLHNEAKVSLSEASKNIMDFSLIDDNEIFYPEKAIIEDCLKVEGACT